MTKHEINPKLSKFTASGVIKSKDLYILGSELEAVIFFSLLLIRQIFDTDFKYLNKSFNGCNLWCFMHITLYIILSYLAPNYWWFLLGFGLFFEFIELYLSNFSKFIESNISTDLILNSIGILLGLLLHKIYPKKIDNQRKSLIKKLLPQRETPDISNLECYTLEKTNIDIEPPNLHEAYGEYEEINPQQCAQQ